MGHELVNCSNSIDVEKCSPDFVLAIASTQAKLNDYPHYAVVHEPRDRFLKNRQYLRNLLTYDGYLTISDTLGRFVRNLSYGARFPKQVGFYYDTPQRQDDIKADLQSLIATKALRITYFGTNWESHRRRPEFFIKFSQSDGVEICGPARSWTHINQKSYGGSLPFDGVSVQRKYASNGIGLVMLSEEHLSDDVISNRIFEITSVGAVAFCCDIPWIRKHYGDTVYYFDQDLPDEALRRKILELRQLVYNDPRTAIKKAEDARRVFETKFCAEIMIENAVKFHSQVSTQRKEYLGHAEKVYSPVVSVIIRCGGRPIEYVKRAVDSIARQTYGHFDVLFVRYKPLDLAALLEARSSRILSVRVLECPGGNRSTTLWAGLNEVKGEYFAILDDDDFWFSDHMERLFHPAPKSFLPRFFTYSGSIALHPSPKPITGGGEDLRELKCFGIESKETWDTIGGAFDSCDFVASTDLLNEDLLQAPELETAEDSFLIHSLLTQVEPRFSYFATSVVEVKENRGRQNSPTRYEDLLGLYLRLFGRNREGYVATDPLKLLEKHWDERPRSKETVDSLVQQWTLVAEGYDPSHSTLYGASSLVDPARGTALVRPPHQPWHYGVVLSLQKPTAIASEYIWIIEIIVRRGSVGVGVLSSADERSYIFRKNLVVSPNVQRIMIPISDLKQMSGLVVQNWDAAGESEAELVGIRAFVEPRP